MKNFLLRLLSLAAVGVAPLCLLLAAEELAPSATASCFQIAASRGGTERIEVSDAEFPKTLVGTKSEPITVSIKSTGNSELVITGFAGPVNQAFTTDLDEFGISEDNPIFLQPGKELTFKVWFEPYAATTYLDSIVFSSYAWCYDSVCVIKGTSVNPIIAVNDGVFNKVEMGQGKDSTTVAVANTGTTELTITGYSALHESAFTTNLADFAISQNNPKILMPTEKFEFKVWYAPTEDRVILDSIIFISDAIREDPICKLYGAGVKGVADANIAADPFLIKILPNPLDSRGGAIEFECPGDGKVEVILFNSLNRQVAVLANEWMKAGKQTIRIPVETLPGGAYSLRIIAGKKVAAEMIILSK